MRRLSLLMSSLLLFCAAVSAQTGDDLKGIQEEADTDGPLLDYKAKGNKVELVGKEKVNGKDAYHLKVTLATGTVRNIYLDAETFFPIKNATKVTRGGV